MIATKDEVEAVDTKVNAIDLTPFAKTEDVKSAVEGLASEEYVDNTVEGYVPVEK